jgi:hypothetical protein
VGITPWRGRLQQRAAGNLKTETDCACFNGNLARSIEMERRKGRRPWRHQKLKQERRMVSVEDRRARATRRAGDRPVPTTHDKSQNPQQNENRNQQGNENRCWTPRRAEQIEYENWERWHKIENTNRPTHTTRGGKTSSQRSLLQWEPDSSCAQKTKLATKNTL